MIEFCPAPVHFTGAVFVCVPEEILKKKAPKSGHVDEPRNSPTTAPLRSTTPKRASGNERAIEWGGGGPPPRLFASGLSLEKAWIPARDRAGTHVAGANLRRFQRDRLPMTEGPGPLSPHFSGEMGTPPGRRGPRGAAPRGTGKAPTTRRVRSTPPHPRPGPGGNQRGRVYPAMVPTEPPTDDRGPRPLGGHPHPFRPNERETARKGQPVLCQLPFFCPSWKNP